MRRLARGVAALVAVAFAAWWLYAFVGNGRYHVTGRYLVDTRTGCMWFADGYGLTYMGCPPQ